MFILGLGGISINDPHRDMTGVYCQRTRYCEYRDLPEICVCL